MQVSMDLAQHCSKIRNLLPLLVEVCANRKGDVSSRVWTGKVSPLYVWKGSTYYHRSQATGRYCKQALDFNYVCIYLILFQDKT